jgi:hypothetical protein
MKKNQLKTIKLNRETLRHLENGSLQQAAAAGSPASPNCCSVVLTCNPCTTG